MIFRRFMAATNRGLVDRRSPGHPPPPKSGDQAAGEAKENDTVSAQSGNP
jgi:hypothetical protein